MEKRRKDFSVRVSPEKDNLPLRMSKLSLAFKWVAAISQCEESVAESGGHQGVVAPWVVQ